MKKIVLILLMLVISVYGEDWLDYGEALAKAKQDNKIVIVMLSQEGCPACEYMRNMMIDNSKVSHELSKHFIPIELDINEDKVPPQFIHFVTPTFYFMDKNSKKLDVVYGRLKPKAFLIKLKEIEAKEGRN